MHDLVAVAAVPGAVSQEYVEGLENYFLGRASRAVRDPSGKVPNIERKSSAPRLSWEEATKQLCSALATKKRLEGGG